MGEETHLGKSLRPDHRADRGGLGDVEHLHRIVGRQIGVDLLLGGNVDAFHRMGENKTVDADHHRHRQLLGEPKRLDVQVDRLLVGLREQLQPSGVAHRHRIRMIVPDVDGRADRAVAQGHHDGQAEARGVVDRLRHEQQALRGGRGIGAGTGGGGADRDRKGGELAFDVDEFAVDQRAFFHQLAEALDDMGLRRDRIGADHFGPAQRDGLGHGVRSLDLLEHRSAPQAACSACCWLTTN